MRFVTIIRNAEDYAEFLFPHLAPSYEVLDVGCGGGSITLGLADRVCSIVGVDLSDEGFEEADDYARKHGIRNIEFRTGNVYGLDFPDDSFDACLCHSVVETLDRPGDALLEVKRILKPGGALGVADVEYGGFIVAGPQADYLRHSVTIREKIWFLRKIGDPYRGRELRGLLNRAGFNDVVATSKYICYGTDDRVKSFGIRQSEYYEGEGFAVQAVKHGLATREELKAMNEAWIEWSESPGSYAAFAWGRAIGFKPEAR